MSLVNPATLPASLAEANTGEGYSVRKNGVKVTHLEYKPKDYSQAYVLKTSLILLEEVCQLVRNVAKETIKSLAEGKKLLSNEYGFFYCSPDTLAVIGLNTLRSSLNNTSSKSKDGNDAKEMGLDRHKLLELTSKVEAVVMEVLRQLIGPGRIMVLEKSGQTQSNFAFNRHQTDSDIDMWFMSIIPRCVDTVYATLKFECLGNASLSQEEYNIEEKQVSTMSCYGYAIAKIAKEQVKEFLLLEQMKTFSLIDWLLDRGWEHVSYPEPQDLVLYRDHESHKIKHGAIYLDNGEVESKPGKLNPRIYKHPVMDVLGLYGTSVVFMRKKK